MKVLLEINKLGVRRLQIRHTTRVTPIATDEKYVIIHKILVAFSFYHEYHYPRWKTKAFDCLGITSSKSDYPGPGDRPLPSRVGPLEIAHVLPSPRPPG